MAPQSVSSTTSETKSPSLSMTSRKRNPAIHFFVVLSLACITLLVHYRCARFASIPTSNTDALMDNHELRILSNNMGSYSDNLTITLLRNDSVLSNEVLSRDSRNHSENDGSFQSEWMRKHDNISISARLHNNNATRSHILQNYTDGVWQELTMRERKLLAWKLKRMSPIIAAGLPKTGTTSLHKYFLSLRENSIFRSSHTYTTLANGTKPRAGACMQENLRKGKKMLKGCGRFHVWTDSGYASAGDCFYPLWHALDEFVEQYPHATIILNTRNATLWTASIQKWANGSLAKRWIRCRNANPKLPRTMKKKQWIKFYNVYHERIRQVCQMHETLNCIEFDIQNENAGRILEASFGIPASHWRNCNPKDFTCIQATATA